MAIRFSIERYHLMAQTRSSTHKTRGQKRKTTADQTNKKVKTPKRKKKQKKLTAEGIYALRTNTNQSVKTAILVNQDQITCNPSIIPTMTQLLQDENEKTITQHVTLTSIEYSDNGTPTKGIAQDGTVMYARNQTELMTLFSDEHAKTPHKSPKLKKGFEKSASVRGVKTPPEDAKKLVEYVLDETELKKIEREHKKTGGKREQSQTKTMKRPGFSEKICSASLHTEAVITTTPKPIKYNKRSLRYRTSEYLHGRAHSNGGKQKTENLIAGTPAANTQQIPLDNVAKTLVSAHGEVKVQVSCETYPGTHVGKGNIKQTITTNEFSTESLIPVRERTRPHIRTMQYTENLFKALSTASLQATHTTIPTAPVTPTKPNSPAKSTVPTRSVTPRQATKPSMMSLFSKSAIRTEKQKKQLAPKALNFTAIT